MPSAIARASAVMAESSRFETLALPHLNSAVNLAYWILRNHDDAEDAVQDAYLRAFRAFAGFHGDQMRPWLLAIVRNSAYRMLQERRRAGDVFALLPAAASNGGTDESGAASDDPDPEAAVIAECDRQSLYAALAEVPLVYREIVVLRDLEGLTYKDIAEAAGVPVGTVMSRLSRGRAEVRKAVVRRLAKDEPDAM
jgi:RNA polymerase sigma-70 factor (ECF subfamily)